MWLSLAALLLTTLLISAAPQQAVLDWACESVNQTKCAFDGCCDPSTYCGTFGATNQTGCCPVNETCSGVGRCSPGDTECRGGGCCPSGAACVTEGDGTLACDYGPRPDDLREAAVGQALVKSAGRVFLPILVLVGGAVVAVVTLS